jgi:hypothetical protein
LLNQWSSIARSRLAITAAGKASWTLGMAVPAVYLSMGALAGACWVSWALPQAAAAVAWSLRVSTLGVVVMRVCGSRQVVRAIPFLAWSVRVCSARVVLWVVLV